MSKETEDPENVGSVKLEVWIQDNGLTHQQFADKIETAKRSIPRWISGQNLPSIEMAQKVFDVTKGFVKLMDWNTPYIADKRRRLEAVLSGQAGKPGSKPKEKKGAT